MKITLIHSVTNSYEHYYAWKLESENHLWFTGITEHAFCALFARYTLRCSAFNAYPVRKDSPSSAWVYETIFTL